MAMNRELLGREYRQAEKHVIDTAQIQRHRDAICAQSFTPLPDYAQRVPASCSLTICQGALTAALLDGDLGLDAMRLVFEGLDISYVHEPVLDSETSASATVTEITSTPDGERLLLNLQLCQPALGPVLNARVAFLERNPRPKPENDGHTGASTSTDAEKPRYYFEHALPLLEALAARGATVLHLEPSSVSRCRWPAPGAQPAAQPLGVRAATGRLAAARRLRLRLRLRRRVGRRIAAARCQRWCGAG